MSFGNSFGGNRTVLSLNHEKVKRKGVEGGRTQSSSSVPVPLSLPESWPSPSEPSPEGFLMTFFWTTG